MMKNGYKCLNSACAIHRNGNELSHPFCEDCAYKVQVEDTSVVEENTLPLDDTIESTEYTKDECFIEEVVEKKETRIKFLYNKFVFASKKTKVIIALVAMVIIFSCIYFVFSSGKDSRSETTLSKVVLGNANSASSNTVLKIYGSNIVGDKLVPAFVKGYFESLGAENIKEIPLKKESETKIVFNMPESTEIKEVEILKMSADDAFDNIAKQKCDIVMSSRKITQYEIGKIMKAGLGEFSLPAHEHIVALDGIAVIVNNKSNLDSISLEKLKKIFNGEISNWSQVGGSDGKINVYISGEKSGNADLFKSLIMEEYKFTKSANIIEDAAELSDVVSRDVNGIGFVGLPYINSSKPMKILETDTISSSPTMLNVKTEDYKLARRLYLYPVKDDQNQHINGLIKFALSEKGQELVEKIDLVTQNIELVPKEDLTEARQFKNSILQFKYNQAIKNFIGRLAVNIRFESTEERLDNKSRDDVIRVVDFLNKGKYIDKKLVLVGFSDDCLSFNKTMAFSEKKVEQVKKELISLNKSLEKRIKTVGLGHELQLSADKKQEGIFKNRRVELWLTSN